MQYWLWLDGVLHGNLGYSYQNQQPVSALIGQNLPSTLVLAGSGLLISLVGGILLGAFAAARRDTAADSVSMGVAMTLVALPSFWLGLILILVFAVALPWFPVVGGRACAGWSSRRSRWGSACSASPAGSSGPAWWRSWTARTWSRPGPRG